MPEISAPIRDILLREFTPREAPLPHNRELYETILKSNSVCISIRRGDYLSSENKNNFFVCGRDYFNRAMQRMLELHPDATFVFFSDDIQWVRENIHTPCPCLYERGDDPIWEKLRLMYSCRHFIISNSTFSWWSQWLGRDPHKTVIAPSHWNNNPRWTSFLITKEMIKL